MYDLTLSPIQTCGTTMKNRIARTGHVTIFSPTNQITEDFIE
jgi:hypothetical protein